MSKLSTAATTLFLLSLIAYIFIVGESLLIPFIVAIVIWYLIITLSHFLQSAPIIGKYLPKPLALFAAFAVSLTALWGLFELLVSNINEMIYLMPVYQQKLTLLNEHFLRKLGLENPESWSKITSQVDFLPYLASTATTLATIARNMGIILIYVLFLLLESHSFDKKLAALIPDKKKLESARRIIQKIAKDIQSYILIKTLISILTALIAYTILIAVGVNLAEFWALMIFLFNFIPTIGAIVATIFPCIQALIQFDTLTPFLIVTISLVATQFVIGNIIEPKLLGKSFNLSGLAIILALAFWGTIWGIAGMFLCIPIMVIANIILANFEETRPISILLSTDGHVE